MASAAHKLREIRLRASPRISAEKLAQGIGMARSSYVRYEDPNDFKREFLPMGMARSVARFLADYGIDGAEVMALAGIDAESFQPELSAKASRLVGIFDVLDPHQQEALLTVAEAMHVAPSNARRSRPTVHEAKREFRHQPA